MIREIVDMMGAIIEFENGVNEYKSGNHILNARDNVSFTIDEGKFIVILEPYGAGKSTLLNLLWVLDSVTSDQIMLDNQKADIFNDNMLTEYMTWNFGFIFQFYN